MICENRENEPSCQAVIKILASHIQNLALWPTMLSKFSSSYFYLLWWFLQSDKKTVITFKFDERVWEVFLGHSKLDTIYFKTGTCMTHVCCDTMKMDLFKLNKSLIKGEGTDFPLRHQDQSFKQALNSNRS